MVKDFAEVSCVLSYYHTPHFTRKQSVDLLQVVPFVMLKIVLCEIDEHLGLSTAAKGRRNRGPAPRGVETVGEYPYTATNTNEPMTPPFFLFGTYLVLLT